MFAFSPVRLHQNGSFFSSASALKCFSSAPTSIFACTCVCASKNDFFYSSAPTSKYLHILVCMCWRLMFSCTYLLLRQNSCVELCKPTSKCLLLLGCVSIKLLLFLVCANINFFFPVVCAPTSNYLLVLVSTFGFFLCNCSNVLLCALFDFLVLYKLEALTAIASVETTHVWSIKFSTIILHLTSTLSDRLKT